MKRLLLFAAEKRGLLSISPLFFAFFLCLALLPGTDLQAQKKSAANAGREYMVLKIYHAATADQLSTIDQYLQASLLPTLEKNGFRKIGVFHAISNDTAADKKTFVLIPFNGISKLEQLSLLTEKTVQDTVTANAYTKAAHNRPSFTRMETILLHSFTGMPQVKAPALKGAREERVYELRSYEAATEALYLNKVKMFNEGEVQLFDRLGFNAVFYGEVLTGCRMPNLMYMTSFENKASRDEHWKSFGSDPEWKKMSALPEYQNNVSKIDITFLRPTAYSKL
ncbi:MAG TPA: NIPSNAP family protein [Flavisolibacter sp.]|nr:NIPSNAP family protein [Flavisolibacter sp.]